VRIDLSTDSTAWYPQQRGAGHVSTHNLKPGALIIYERKPYRLLTITEDDPLAWPNSTRERWADAGMPDPKTWERRPFTLSLRHEPEPDAEPVWLSAIAGYAWRTLPEHYAVCHRCNELPPCTHVHTETVMEVEAKRMDVVMAILPGCCHACREPITKRQKTIVFEGANLTRPDLGDGSAIFHVREGCRFAAQTYDARWAAAEPSRRRRLYCEGQRRNHYDGTAECSEGEQCPGDVRHRGEEWHRPVAGRLTSGCWCVSGDLTVALERDNVPSERGRDGTR
jgi:hypothetical protein